MARLNGIDEDCSPSCQDCCKIANILIDQGLSDNADSATTPAWAAVAGARIMARKPEGGTCPVLARAADADVPWSVPAIFRTRPYPRRCAPSSDRTPWSWHPTPSLPCQPRCSGQASPHEKCGPNPLE